MIVIYITAGIGKIFQVSLRSTRPSQIALPRLFIFCLIRHLKGCMQLACHYCHQLGCLKIMLVSFHHSVAIPIGEIITYTEFLLIKNIVVNLLRKITSTYRSRSSCLYVRQLAASKSQC
jgi:hypothetical protein